VSSTLERMREACGRVDSGRSFRPTYIEALADLADDMVAEVQRLGAMTLADLGGRMRANSERWFPAMHAAPAVPMAVFYALGMAGEAGEVANVVKKALRRGLVIDDVATIADELADVFTYLLLLANECGVDLIAAYEGKAAICEQRWGTAA
jgi:NTP pyrophosphatase (non-canonical NTP hydrolase)